MKKYALITFLVLAVAYGGARKTWALPVSGEPYREALRRAEQKYNLPHGLLARVAYQESRFRPDIVTGHTVSHAGAMGIMQIVPRWHPGVDPLDPEAAIDYAGSYLHKLYRQFGSWPKALAAYNWGPGNLARVLGTHGDAWLSLAVLPGETYNYVHDITRDVVT